MARRSAVRSGPQPAAYAPSNGADGASGQVYAPADPWNDPADPGGKAARKQEKQQRGGRWGGSGGRWGVWIGRLLLWAVLLVVLVNGVIAIVQRQTDSGDDPAPGTQATRGSDGKPVFPETAASGYAIQFAHVYLNYDAKTKGAAEARTQQLARFLPDGQSGQFGWNSEGVMVLQSAQVAGVAPRDANNALVTVTARVNNKWLQLAIPVFAKDGAMVVSGHPAILPAPPKAQFPQPPKIDSDQVPPELNETLTGFFKAYGSGDDLSRYAEGSITGLSGAVTFGQLRQVVMPKASGDVRKVYVSVIWRIPSEQPKVADGELEQTYELTVVKKDNRWWVRDKHGSTQPMPS